MEKQNWLERARNNGMSNSKTSVLNGLNKEHESLVLSCPVTQEPLYPQKYLSVKG